MKKIGGAIYIHRSNIDELTDEQFELVENALTFLAKSQYPVNSYDIIKIDIKNIAVTFIESEDWDNAREPIVGDAYRVNADGNIKLIKKKNNPQIYHHKWMFVASDYTGFDVEESKAWSTKWQSTIPKGHGSKIGYKNYWEDLLKKYDL